MTLTARRFTAVWIVPVATVGAAFLSAIFSSSLRERIPLFLFLAAVIVSTWHGGWTSGFLATILAAFFTARLLGPPYHAARVAGDDAFRWLIFVLMMLVISFVPVVLGRVKRRLHASEQRLSFALDSGGCGVWDYNLLTREFWWSERMETIYGQTHDSFPRTYGSFLERIHIDDQPRDVGYRARLIL